MSTIDRNVVITFDPILEDEFIKLSKAVSEKVSSKINLNKENEIPHMTLYMSKYPAQNEQLIIAGVNEVAKEFKSFPLMFDSKTCHTSGTIFINSQKSETLLRLHGELVDALNSLREGLFNEDELLLPGITDDKKKNLKKFGMWSVKGFYEPHVSVARVTDLNDGPLALSALPNKIEFETQVKTISVVIRGHDGTCAKILRTFTLQG